MLSLVRYAFCGLTIFAHTCGVQANDEHTVATSTSAIVAATTQTIFEAKDGGLSVLPTIGTAAGTAVCPSRTINYITHTLAQQCLRTDWSRARAGNLVASNRTSYGSPTTASSATVDLRTAAGTALDASTISSVVSTDAAHARTNIPSASGTIMPATESLECHAEGDVESPLDNAHFLSFEEWKKQNLAKAGQSGENIGARQQYEPGRRPAAVNTLESLGEESEIELDFSGFGGAPMRSETDSEHSSSGPSATTDGIDVGQVSPASQALRPRDAGKTCKERTNYASFDCAATVLKSNQECKSASSVLVENKDSYMLNKCSASNKYFVVELCNDILVDTVVLANYEFFSSIFRTFRVSVSDRYPVKSEKWKDLGTFEARNAREVQAFLIENPLIWARYLRIEFITHYGSEYYCPVSLLRVHGTTMMEEFRNQEELARGESQDDELIAETVDVAVSETLVTPALAPIESKTNGMHDVAELETSTINATVSQSDVTLQLEHPIAATSPTSTATAIAERVSTLEDIQPMTTAHDTCPSGMSTTIVQPDSENVSTASGTQSGSTSSSGASIIEQKHVNSVAMSSSATAAGIGTSTMAASVNYTASTSPSISNSASLQPADNQTATPVISPTTSVNSSSNALLSSANKDTPPKAANSTKSATSSSPQAQPSTQESFFKSISKRLQQLESNSTLSLQYIEEQSRILRDAFSKVEKRQINTTTSFLANLNNTVMVELAGFRQAYDQLWQSTVIELEGQREQYQRELTALSSRLTLVVDELVWQKRMGVVQSTLLLLCLGMVLFTRPGNGTFEASLAQQVMARSQAAFRSGAGSDQNSPAAGRSPVSLLRRRVPLWRKGTEPVLEHPDSASLSPALSLNGRDSLVGSSPTHDPESAYDEDDDEEALSEVSVDLPEQVEGYTESLSGAHN